jgi:hypothetical protein
VVDRDRHAPITDLRQQLDRVEQIVMGQSVGVVAEVHEFEEGKEKEEWNMGKKNIFLSLIFFSPLWP